jgi:hypothetical protein
VASAGSARGASDCRATRGRRTSCRSAAGPARGLPAAARFAATVSAAAAAAARRRPGAPGCAARTAARARDAATSRNAELVQTALAGWTIDVRSAGERGNRRRATGARAEGDPCRDQKAKAQSHGGISTQEGLGCQLPSSRGPTQGRRGRPTTWLGLPTTWLGLPTTRLGLPTTWLGLPTTWLGLPTTWLGLPTIWLGLPATCPEKDQSFQARRHPSHFSCHGSRGRTPC